MPAYSLPQSPVAKVALSSLEQVSWLPGSLLTRLPMDDPQWRHELSYPVQLREQQPDGISLIFQRDGAFIRDVEIAIHNSNSPSAVVNQKSAMSHGACLQGEAALLPLQVRSFCRYALEIVCRYHIKVLDGMEGILAYSARWTQRLDSVPTILL